MRPNTVLLLSRCVPLLLFFFTPGVIRWGFFMDFYARPNSPSLRPTDPPVGKPDIPSFVAFIPLLTLFFHVAHSP